MIYLTKYFREVIYSFHVMQKWRGNWGDLLPDEAKRQHYFKLSRSYYRVTKFEQLSITHLLIFTVPPFDFHSSPNLDFKPDIFCKNRKNIVQCWHSSCNIQFWSDRAILTHPTTTTTYLRELKSDAVLSLLYALFNQVTLLSPTQNEKILVLVYSSGWGCSLSFCFVNKQPTAPERVASTMLFSQKETFKSKDASRTMFLISGMHYLWGYSLSLESFCKLWR